MRLIHGSSLAVLSLGLMLLPGLSAAGTWPSSRHDAARTGASNGAFPPGPPEAVWRTYMGGTPRDWSVRFGLEDPSVVVANSGGRFFAKHVITQAKLWQTDLVGTGKVVDLVDVDGNGSLEVVAHTDERAYLFDGATGATLWASPLADFGRIGAARAADMDGDGLADVYLDDGSTSKAGDLSAAAYTFAGGINNPAYLWKRIHNETPQSVDQGTDSIVDLDGDGVPEVVLTSHDVVSILRGNNGSGQGDSVIAYLKPTSFAGHPFAQADSIAAHLDTDPGAELLVIQPHGSVAGQYGPPNLMAFKIDPVTKTWSHLWTRTVGYFDGEMVGVSDVASDLDGDGKAEVIFSHRVLASSPDWTTELLDGTTGATLTSLAGARFEGAAELDQQPGAEIVVATPNGLIAYALQNGSLVALTGPLADYRAMTMIDSSLRQHGHAANRLAVLHRTGKPPVMLAGKPASTAPYDDLAWVNSFSNAQSLTIDAGGWVLGNIYTPLTGHITDVVRADFSTRPYEQFAMGTTDGTLDVLDEAMKVTNGIADENDPPAGTLLGGAMQLTIGAFAGPLIGVAVETPIVVLPGSSKGVLVADASSASWVIPPVIQWTGDAMTAPSIIPLGPSIGDAVVGVEGYSLAARHIDDGTLIKSVPLGPGIPWGTPLPLFIHKTPIPLVGIDWRIAGTQIVQTAVHFGTGKVAWAGAPMPYGGYFASGVGDLNKDGTDEWYSAITHLKRRTAQAGALTDYPSLSTGYAIPMVASFNTTTSRDLLLQSGINKKLVLATNNLTLDWETEVGDQVNVMGGAYVGCPNAARFVTPAVQSPALYAYDGPTGTQVGQVVLAGGSAFATVQEAEQAQARIGWLTNTTSIADAGGAGPAVLVGSSDGFVYALNGCTMSLLWAKDMGAPAAVPVIGNVDNDDTDEIVVGVADGYIYGLDWPSLPPPHCLTLNGKSCNGETVQVAAGDSVSASWDAVPDATGYEIALLSPADRPLWNPPYRAVNGTSASVELTGGLAKRPYRAVVRAVKGSVRGGEAFSAPIVISDTSPPGADIAGNAQPNKNAAIDIDASDDLALDHYVIWWKESADDDAALQVLTDGMLSGKHAEATPTFSLPPAATGKSIALAVDVVDSGWNVGRAWLAGKVGADGTVSFPTPAPIEPSGDSPGIAEPAGCTAGRPATAPAWSALMLAALLGAALRRSRNHRAR